MWDKTNTDDFVRELVELHFGPDGSTYCHDLMRRFPNIDFKKDIQTPEDRIHLPIESDDIIRMHGIEYFIPRSILRINNKITVGTSSGTTGPKKPCLGSMIHLNA